MINFSFVKQLLNTKLIFFLYISHIDRPLRDTTYYTNGTGLYVSDKYKHLRYGSVTFMIYFQNNI